jgi:hypothetical protein
MKSIKVAFKANYDPFISMYHSPNPRFCWIGHKVGSTYQQASEFHSCRETFAGVYGKKYLNLLARNFPGKLSTKKLKVMLAFRNHTTNYEKTSKNRDKWVEESVRILNLIEKNMKWGKTRVYKCIPTAENAGSSDAYVFTGSFKWLRSPQLISMYLLMLRIGRYHTILSKNVKNLEDLYDLKDVFIKARKSNANDVKWFLMVGRNLKTIMDNHKYLFFFRSPKTNFAATSSNQGISWLLSKRTSGDKELRTRWKKVSAY